MHISMYRFTFAPSVPMADVEATLRLAVLAVQSLLPDDGGLPYLRVTVDHRRQACWFEATPQVGETLAQIFGGFVRQEFGPDAVNPPADAVATGGGA